MECDEHSCKNRTRQSHFYKTHSRCIVPGCKGIMRAEVRVKSCLSFALIYTLLKVTSEQVYNQLQYYQHLFDVDKYKPPGKPISGIRYISLLYMSNIHVEPIRGILSVQDQSTFTALHKKATQYLSKSALHHVNLGSWFSYYDVIKN